MAVYVNCPEQWMVLLVGWVWKTHQINCDMPNDPFFIQNFSNRLAYGHEVHLRQTCLRKEAPCIDIFLGCKFVKGTNQVHSSIWLYKEGYRRRCKQVRLAHGSCFYYSTNPAKMLYVFIPILEKTLLG
mmetsp:Transcript_13168/g.13002  ORF Transcript_13168/g.13002 Transcript_13168/m.13002 type:complete len:128 (-) Transcript_13168:1316-1699(-)